MERLHFTVAASDEEVSAIWETPSNGEPRATLVFAHGQAVGMDHPFMKMGANCLANEGIATFRFNFPYMETGRETSDPFPTLVDAFRSAAEAASTKTTGEPLLAGGKSLGARVAAEAAGQGILPDILGLVFFGFPIHAPDNPTTSRGTALRTHSLPLLFLQGSLDPFARVNLMQALCEDLGSRATLYVIDGGGHSFEYPESDGIPTSETMELVSAAVANWVESLI
ncbi:MAG TPA: alpha/beta family hydrolase [Candidatus Lokiarchaeia archaeon]|nr:alpha/beta family hydrolase [Candidatus Lokiarchaeia archaeon]